MGQTLSEPVTAKETHSVANHLYKVGSSSMQGWRINMEDSHTHLLSMPGDKNGAFFAVYDGHGGAKVAQYAGANLHKKIVSTEEYQNGRYDAALREGFLTMDEDMMQDEELKDELAGTTAIVCLVKNNRIYCANVGDSRAVLSVSGLAESLSYDHKPANEPEARRIVAAGGWVEFNRVNGNLALSRALGDFVFKRNEEKSAAEQIVTAEPEIIVRELSADVEFMVLACDGIWDVMSNQEVVDFCRDRLAANIEPEVVCEELLTRCLAPDCQMGGLGCDNMTAVLVCLLNPSNSNTLPHTGTAASLWPTFISRVSRPRPPSPVLDLPDDEYVPEDPSDEELVDAAGEHPPHPQGDPGAGGSPFVTPPRTPNAHQQASGDGQEPLLGVNANEEQNSQPETGKSPENAENVRNSPVEHIDDADNSAGEKTDVSVEKM